jgi:hypothetical protein
MTVSKHLLRSPTDHAQEPEIDAYPLPDEPSPGAERETEILGPLRFRGPNGNVLSFFGMFATFDRPFEVNASELAIELLFPSDQSTVDSLLTPLSGHAEQYNCAPAGAWPVRRRSPLRRTGYHAGAGPALPSKQACCRRPTETCSSPIARPSAGRPPRGV